MRNILLSLFVLSCLFVNTTFAEEVKADPKKTVEANYEDSGSQDLVDPSLSAGSTAGTDGTASIKNNKIEETIKQAEIIKNQSLDYENNSDNDEAGEEAKDSKTDKALNKVDEELVNTAKKTEEVEVLEEVDEDLMKADKEVIEEDEAATPEKK